MRDMPWHNIWSSDNPVEVLNKNLFLLVGRYVPTKIIRARNKDKPWFDDQCRCSLQVDHLRWTSDRSDNSDRDRSHLRWTREEFVSCKVRANETYSEDKHQFSVRNIDVLMNVHSLISGGSLLCSLCSARVRHCLPWSVRVGDWCVSRLEWLICCQIILTASSPGSHVDLLVTCHPSPSLITFAFRSSEVKRLLLDLDPYGGTDPLGMFPLFLKYGSCSGSLSQCGVSTASSSG